MDVINVVAELCVYDIKRGVNHFKMASCTFFLLMGKEMALLNLLMDHFNGSAYGVYGGLQVVFHADTDVVVELIFEL